MSSHLWDCGGDETEVNQRQVGEEEAYGVWRWESDLKARMMSRLPSTVSKYMNRNSPRMRSCRCGSSDNPRTINFAVSGIFSGFILWMGLVAKNDRKINSRKVI